jgi:hypothetical protein
MPGLTDEQATLIEALGTSPEEYRRLIGPSYMVEVTAAVKKDAQLVLSAAQKVGAQLTKDEAEAIAYRLSEPVEDAVESIVRRIRRSPKLRTLKTIHPGSVSDDRPDDRDRYNHVYASVDVPAAVRIDINVQLSEAKAQKYLAEVLVDEVGSKAKPWASKLAAEPSIKARFGEALKGALREVVADTKPRSLANDPVVDKARLRLMDAAEKKVKVEDEKGRDPFERFGDLYDVRPHAHVAEAIMSAKATGPLKFTLTIEFDIEWGMRWRAESISDWNNRDNSAP